MYENDADSVESSSATEEEHSKQFKDNLKSSRNDERHKIVITKATIHTNHKSNEDLNGLKQDNRCYFTDASQTTTSKRRRVEEHNYEDHIEDRSSDSDEETDQYDLQKVFLALPS